MSSLTNKKNLQLNNDPKLSIIIPAFNAESVIERCLHSITSQNYPREKYEIIVVDDGSTDRTVLSAKNAGADIVISMKYRSGPGNARNNGIKQAHGELFAFIDSDCEAANDWIKTIIKELHSLEAIGGTIENGNAHSKHAWAEYFIEFGGFNKNKKRSPIRFFPTCNGACHREVFFKAGGFKKSPTAEDVLFGDSLKQIGVNLMFIPELKIQHFCRTNLKKVLLNTKKLGRGFVIARRIAPSLPYSKLIKSRLFLPLIFFGKIGTTTSYAIKGKMTKNFLITFPYLILAIASYCSGVWSEYNSKTNKIFRDHSSKLIP